MANGASVTSVSSLRRLASVGLTIFTMLPFVACASGTGSVSPAAACVPAPVALQPGSLITPAPGATGVSPTIGQITLAAYSVSTVAGARVTLTPTTGSGIVTSASVTASRANLFTATIPTTLSSGTTYKVQFTYDPGTITCHVLNTTDIGTFAVQ